MHLDMRLVVLVDKRLDRLHVHDVHVLRDRIDWLLIFFDRDDLLDVTQPQHLQHLPVQLGQVVELRSALRELKHCLVLNDPLRHRRRVGI